MRGMVVEDDHDLSRHAALNLQSRNYLPPSNPISYNTFPQPDYNSSYPTPQHVRESFSDSPFSYDPYRMSSDPPAYSSPSIQAPVYPNISPMDPHRRPNFLYDYAVNPRPAPQFYYPTQGLIYGHPGPSPLATPQLLSGNMGGHDKIEVQVGSNSLRDGIALNFDQYPTMPTPMISPMSSLIPPHNTNFGTLDPSTTHLVPFGAAHMSQFVPMTPVYSNGVLPYPNHIRLTTAVRSNLLEEFRTRKSRKWELIVSLR